MALQFRISNALAIALADIVDDHINAGTQALLRIYDGTIPTDVDTGVGAQVLLAELTMSATAFGAGADANPGGRITAATITGDASANATGTATWWLIITQNAGTIVCMGSYGTSGCDINGNTAAFVAGSTVDVTSLTITVPEQ